MAEKLRVPVPNGLAARGAAFWAEIVGVYGLEDAELQLLREACAMLDLIDVLAARVEADGPVTTGSRGQPVAHPGLGQLMSARALVAKLLAALSFPGEEKVWSDASRRAQAAANSRWAQDAAVRELRKATS